MTPDPTPILTKDSIPIIIAIIGAVIALIQIIANILRNKFDKKIKRAEFGHKLIDELFDDTLAMEFLQSYDSISPKYKTASGLTKNIFIEDYYREMKVYNDNIINGKFVAPKLNRSAIKIMENLLERVDSLLFHFNRIQDSLKNGVTNKNSIYEPLKYYMDLINEYNESDDSLIKYANITKNSMSIDFMQVMNK